MHRLFHLPLLLGLSSLTTFAALPTPDPDNGGLILPPGFRALVVADNLVAGRMVGKNKQNLRFLAPAPNGDLYAKTYHGGLIALRDTDGDGRFDQKEEFGDPAGGGTAIAVRGDWLYHSSNTTVYRYKLTPGVLVPTGEPEVIVEGLPDRGNHNSKSFAFDDQGRMLVAIGSPQNVFGDNKKGDEISTQAVLEHQKTFGGFWRFDAEKNHQTQADGQRFATGLRHSVGFAWNPVSKDYFITMMGRDRLNAIAPAYYDELDNAERISEEMHRLREGVNLGWPYTYWDPIKKARMMAPEYGGDGRLRADPAKYDAPVVAFPAHWAPLQTAFYQSTQFPKKYRGGAFVAFHGSWNRAPLPQGGFNVGFVPFDEKGQALGTFEVFVANIKPGSPGIGGVIKSSDGTLVLNDADRTRTTPNSLRMGGLAVAPDGSLFVSDTDRGRIWRIFHTGTDIASTDAAKPSALALNPAGEQLYTQACAVCHMADGAGVPAMQPALLGSPVVKGDPRRLLRVILEGPAAVLPADRAKFTNVMPAFGALTDTQIADLTTYLRQAFGEKASAVTPADVADARKGAAIR